MSGLFGLIEVGKNSLFAHQAALGVVNHNIANASTPGYSRQRITLAAQGSVLGLFAGVGGGVSVESIERISNQFIMGQLGRARADHGEQSALASGLASLEALIGEPVDDTMGDSGLGDVMADFLSSWQPVINPELSADPADLRGLIIEAGRLLASRFNSLSEGISEQADSLQSQLAAGVAELNATIESVAELNRQIADAGIADSARSDLEDSRQLQLQRLAELAGADWRTDENGKLRVYAGGLTLVDGAVGHPVALEQTGALGDRCRGARLSMAGGAALPLAEGGELRGLLTLLNEALPGILSRLDRLAAHLAAGVNAIHQSATGDGGGVDVFVGGDAATLAVNPVLLRHPEMLSLTGVLPDGRDIATAIFELHGAVLAGENGLSLEGLYAGMVGELGAQSASAQDLSRAAERLLTGYEEKLESETGVSLDEELAEMMIVQASFQAASKVITLVDDLLATVLTLL